MYQDKKRTSEIIQTIIKNAENEDNTTIGKFVETLGDRAFGIAILVFSLPNSLPIPSVPGFSAITGIPIILFGLQMAIGQKSLWLPKRVHDYSFSQVTLAKVLKKALPFLRKMEKILKPRMLFMLSPLAERGVGLAFLILGIILAFPIPFGNFLPGISLSIIALGLIERDGLIITAGIISGMIAGSVISAAVTVFIKGLLASIHALF